VDTATRVKAAKARIDENRAALMLARDAGPPCTKCTHYVPIYNRDPARNYRPSLCTHPAYQDAAYSLESGRVAQIGNVPAYKARAQDGLCGPEGVLFERAHHLLTLFKDWRMMAFMVFVAFWISVLYGAWS
jgi:hypothetical protein